MPKSYKQYKKVLERTDLDKNIFLKKYSFATGGPLKKPNFIKRLENPNRTYTQDWQYPNMITTHKMSWATDDKGAFVYPQVQEVNGELIDFTRPPYNSNAGLNRALETKDYKRMSSESAANFYTKNYKNLYPKGNTFADGGQLNNNWNSLSMMDKRSLIKMAVQNGVYNIMDIRDMYNNLGEQPSTSLEINSENGTIYANGGEINSYTPTGEQDLDDDKLYAQIEYITSNSDLSNIEAYNLIMENNLIHNL